MQCSNYVHCYSTAVAWCLAHSRYSINTVEVNRKVARCPSWRAVSGDRDTWPQLSRGLSGPWRLDSPRTLSPVAWRCQEHCLKKDAEATFECDGNGCHGRFVPSPWVWGRRWWPTCMFAVWHRAVSLSGKGLVRQNHKGQREA